MKKASMVWSGKVLQAHVLNAYIPGCSAILEGRASFGGGASLG